MKKLNSKGFTLVELLAVIVILAIVVGITMVTIIPTLSSNRESAFETAVETIQVYLQEEYDNCLLGDTSIATFSVFTEGNCGTMTTGYSESNYAAVLTKTGYTGDIFIKAVTVSNGRVSVVATVPCTLSENNTKADNCTGKYKSVTTYNGTLKANSTDQYNTYTAS